MAYGFTVYNEAGGVLANDTDFNFGLYQEGTININPNLGPIPPIDINITGIQEAPITFFRVLNSRRIVIAATFIQSANLVRVQFSPYNTTYSSDDPYPITVEYRVYIPMRYLSPAANETYGLVIYDSNLNKTFDSRLKPPLITATYDITFPVWNGSYLTGFPQTQSVDITNNFAGYPWVYTTDVSNLYKGVYYAGTNSFGPLRFYINTGIRISDNKLRYEYVRTSNNIGYGDGPLNWNNASGKTYSVFLLQSEPTPISAWIDAYTFGGATCSYSSGTCQTIESYVIEFVGGNGTAVTYSWSLINNTGSLSLFSANGGPTMTVEKTASAGTYTATLRCEITQSGTAYAFTKPITFVHSQSGNLVSPMVNASNTSWSSNDIQYESASASTTTKIWMTNDGQIWIQEGTYAPRNGAPTSAWWSNASYVFGGGVAGIGASYWVRFTRTSYTGDPAESTATTGWLSLATDQSVSVDAAQGNGLSGIVQNSATYTVEVASTSTGGSPISTTPGITISASADSVDTVQP